MSKNKPKTTLEIGKEIGTIFEIIKEIVSDLTIDEIKRFEEYVKEQETISPLFNPTLYLRLQNNNSFERIVRRIKLLKEIKEITNERHN